MIKHIMEYVNEEMRWKTTKQFSIIFSWICWMNYILAIEKYSRQATLRRSCWTPKCENKLYPDCFYWVKDDWLNEVKAEVTRGNSHFGKLIYIVGASTMVRRWNDETVKAFIEVQPIKHSEEKGTLLWIGTKREKHFGLERKERNLVWQKPKPEKRK